VYGVVVAVIHPGRDSFMSEVVVLGRVGINGGEEYSRGKYSSCQNTTDDGHDGV
jgi:hypothetical protein